MRKIAFIDRDGTIIVEPQETKQVNGLEQIEFLPLVISSLKKLQNAGYEIVVVSNQDGLGTSANPARNYELINEKILQILQSENIKISDWLTCPHYEKDNCNCRKPLTGMVVNYIGKIDLGQSVMIGDRDSDVKFANNLLIKGYKIGEEFGWNEVVSQVLQRHAIIERKTGETDILVALNLDGKGDSKIASGLNFLDHMLQQVARHGSFDLEVRCKGDLEIDEHHTIEDIAIALGEAYKKALGDKKGIARFASERIIPLDEALAFVSLDISNRPHCEFKAQFVREYVGDLPTEMIAHFFQSFAISAGLTLHIRVEGDNTHHKVEAIFKSFAKCLYDASRIVSSGVVSTKGKL